MDFIFQFFAEMQEKIDNNVDAMADQYAANAADASVADADIQMLNIFQYVNFH